MPRFSVILVHFDGAVSDQELHRGLGALEAQTFRDFEILAYHDGPVSRDGFGAGLAERYPHVRRVVSTGARAADWGHSLRDRGIREARGEYLVHFNADNLLYPFALAEIDRTIRWQRDYLRNDDGVLFDSNDIVIFPILMRGMDADGRYVWRDRNWQQRREPLRNALICTGYPVELNFIDCMQLVMRRTTWLAEGGWSNREERSDGILYPRFVERYGAKYVNKILGEHW
ncbi:MAG: glycosyltransferase family 2 protein [Alphaproteobacteria bacterium]